MAIIYIITIIASVVLLLYLAEKKSKDEESEIELKFKEADMETIRNKAIEWMKMYGYSIMDPFKENLTDRQVRYRIKKYNALKIRGVQYSGISREITPFYYYKE